MKLRNSTDIENDLVKQIIKFVRPSGIANFDVMVKNGEQLAGRAYPKGSGYHDTANAFVVCRIPKQVKPTKLRTYQIAFLKGRRYWLTDRTEALVYLLAHELRHLWQGKTRNKAGYNFGS